MIYDYIHVVHISHKTKRSWFNDNSRHVPYFLMVCMLWNIGLEYIAQHKLTHILMMMQRYAKNPNFITDQNRFCTPDYIPIVLHQNLMPNNASQTELFWYPKSPLGTLAVYLMIWILPGFLTSTTTTFLLRRWQRIYIINSIHVIKHTLYPTTHAIWTRSQILV